MAHTQSVPLRSYTSVYTTSYSPSHNAPVTVTVWPLGVETGVSRRPKASVTA